MIRLEHHRDCSLLSFQEERALPWLMRSGGLSSNVNAAISFVDGIDRRLLWQCLQVACATYDAIRTRFTESNPGSFRRLVLPEEECPVEFTELHEGASLADPTVTQAVADFCNKPFAFEDENWFRALLIHTAEKSSVLAISMPHVVSDATSLRILMARIWQDYTQLAQGKMLIRRTPRYGLIDFVGSQRAWGATADFENRLNQLTDYVATGIEKIRRENPAKYDQPVLAARPSTAVIFKFPEALCSGLEKLAKQTQAGLVTTLIAAAILATARLFQMRQFCFRLPFSNRILAGSDDVVGFLANDVPIFVSIDETQDVQSFIKTIQRTSFATTMRFGAVPWAVLKERLLELPLLLSGRNPFEDYLINVFPPSDNLATESGYCARPFPMLLSGFTSNELKVWMHAVNGRVIMALRVGIEQKDVAESRYMPEFVRVFTQMANHPQDNIGALLNDVRLVEHM